MKGISGEAQAKKYLREDDQFRDQTAAYSLPVR
jgi:hypothetical protein